MLPDPQVFGVPLNWYYLFSIIALLSYTIFFLYTGRKQHFHFLELLLIIYGVTIIGSVGARVFSVIENFIQSDFGFYQYDFIGEFKHGVGHRWYGSLFIVLLCLPVLLLKHAKEKFFVLFDLLMLTGCIALIIGKLGCFLDGHYGCYGIATDLSIGVSFPYGSAPPIHPVYPVQLFDSIFHFLLLIVLLYIWKRRRPGYVATTFLLSTSVYNILIEILRTNQEIFAGLSFAQIIYLVILLAGCTLVLYRSRYFHYSEKVLAEPI